MRREPWVMRREPWVMRREPWVMRREPWVIGENHGLWGNENIMVISMNQTINHMPHSFNKIWIHAIWSTKERNPLIKINIERKVHEYMRQQFIESGCPVRIINGMPDHLHSLFLLNPKRSIAEVIKQVKGSVSHWVNEQDLIVEKCSWQTGYAAYSVSESQLEKVFRYIKGQKAHHSKQTFSKEYEAFIKIHGFIED